MARPIKTNLDFENVARIQNLPDPSTAQEPATKAYVDSAVEGLAWKDSVRVSTQSNINLSSPGAAIDGVTMASPDRVLVRSQSTAAENGIYVWNGAAVAMTRAPDASTFAELEQAVVTVEEGSSAGATFRQTEVNGTIGSSAVTWTSFGGSSPTATETTAGIAEIATQPEVDAGTDDARIPTTLKIKSASWMLRKYSADFGDGSATQYTITHNLGTRDVTVAVYRNSGAYDEVILDIEHTTTNTVTVRLASAPTLNQFRCVVIG